MGECKKNDKKHRCGKKCKTDKKLELEKEKEKEFTRFYKKIFSLVKKVEDFKKLKKNLIKKR